MVVLEVHYHLPFSHVRGSPFFGCQLQEFQGLVWIPQRLISLISFFGAHVWIRNIFIFNYWLVALCDTEIYTILIYNFLLTGIERLAQLPASCDVFFFLNRQFGTSCGNRNLWPPYLFVYQCFFCLVSWSLVPVFSLAFVMLISENESLKWTFACTLIMAILSMTMTYIVLVIEWSGGFASILQHKI